MHWQAPEFFDTHCRAVLDWREEYTDTPSGSMYMYMQNLNSRTLNSKYEVQCIPSRVLR